MGGGVSVFVFVFVCLSSSCVCLADMKVKHFEWEVEYMFHSPDGVEKMVMGINGHFPGPTLRVKSGDTIVVRLTNKLVTEGLVMHWHGIRQIGTPWADGTASISQCAIDPGNTFVYRFKADKPGTYFYHGHYGMQRAAGLYGSLIVDVGDEEKEKFEYDGEFSLLLSDWYHLSVFLQELQLSSKPFRWVGEPQSILINGRGQYNCSVSEHVSKAWGWEQCKLKGGEQYAPRVLHVRPKKTYRLRIASTTSLSALNLQISDHKMVVVEADGNYVEPLEVSDLDIYSGETYSVLITADQLTTSNYWVQISVRGRLPLTPPALTLLNYHGVPVSHTPTVAPPTSPLWNDFTHSKSFSRRLLAANNSNPPPTTPYRRIILLNTQNKINGFTKWAINNVSLTLPATPYMSLLTSLKPLGARHSPPDNFSANYDVMKPAVNPSASYGSGVYVLKFGSTVDVVLQNANALAVNTSEIHPWHLHGHDFWILGYGEGRFRDEDKKVFNLRNPPMKNTAVLYPFGWTALRFVADNAGLWAFHCHIEPHLHMGMGVVMAEGLRWVGKVPREAVSC